MKTKSHLFGWAAVVLSLAACQRQAPVNPNPTYNSETNTVTAQFVLNLSTSNGKDTKTTAQYAQVGGSFLGMDQVHMLAYNLGDENKGKETAATQGHFFFNPMYYDTKEEKLKPIAATRDFALGSLFSAGEVSTDKSSRIVELALPLGTNAVALYGKATKTADSDYQGSTIATGDPSDLSTLKFTLESRMASEKRFNVGAFFFSSMMTYFVTSGLVNESSFWTYPSGNQDRSYAFWFPVPDSTVEAQLPADPNDQDTAEVGGVTYTFYKGQLSWKNLGTMHYYEITPGSPDPSSLYTTNGSTTKSPAPYRFNPLGDVLGQAYYSIVYVVKKGTSYKELRAGSAASIIRVCEDLYSIVEKCVSANPTTWEEYAAQLLAKQIKGRMERYFARYDDGFNFIRGTDGGVNIAQLKVVTESASSQAQYNVISEDFLAEFGVDYFYNVSAGYYGFPQNVGLPYGAAIMECAPNWSDQKDMDDFSYTQDIPAYGMGGATFPIKNYRFPPELMYYGNSSLRISDKEKKISDFPGAASLWGDDDMWNSDWESKGTVKASTRSVAMKNSINYGTALLRSVVRYADGVTALKDNNSELHPGEQDNSISVTTGGGFLVTGIVVGGQADVMGWDFTRYPDSGDYTGMGWDATNQKYTGLSFDNNKFDKMIYDRVVNGYTIGQSTTPIYTMVWDNYDATKGPEEQSDVYIAVELYNQTGQDFWGELNMVRKNGIFYLVGKLSLEQAKTAARASNQDAFKNLARSDYNYPPFNPLTGETVNAPRVFMQDYVTDATLLLNADALKHAYLTVPDLRTSQVSLGLSIDLTWQPGLAFVVNMGVLE